MKSPSPSPSEIITRRTGAGFTQTQAAEMVHSGLRTWQQWEKGDRKMPPGLWELFSMKINLPSLKLEDIAWQIEMFVNQQMKAAIQANDYHMARFHWHHAMGGKLVWDQLSIYVAQCEFGSPRHVRDKIREYNYEISKKLNFITDGDHIPLFKNDIFDSNPNGN